MSDPTDKSYGIVDVLKDVATGDLELAADDVVTARKELCDGCEMKTPITQQCAACGCFIPAKIRLAKSECPLELWGASSNDS